MNLSSYISIFITINIISNTVALLFPASTVFQITAGVSWPVPLPDDRKLFLNVGFQANYNLPYRTNDFTNPPYWPSLFERSFHNNYDISVNSTLDKGCKENRFSVMPSENVDTKSNDKREFRSLTKKYKRQDWNLDNDLSAGEFYKFIENYLNAFNYDASCLEKSICQLSKHPLRDSKYTEEDIIIELIEFLLLPSQHQGFFDHEHSAKIKYVTAETIGLNGGNCDEAYPICSITILDQITKIKSVN